MPEPHTLDDFEQLMASATSAAEARRLLEEQLAADRKSVADSWSLTQHRARQAACTLKVFDPALVVLLCHWKAANDLAGNRHLGAREVEELLWRLVPTYPAVHGMIVNMARQYHQNTLRDRSALRRLIEVHGITAAHPVARRLFAIAVQAVSRDLRLPSSFSASDAYQVLLAFPGWPADWEEALAPARVAYESDFRSEPARISRSEQVIGGLIGLPIFAGMFLLAWAKEGLAGAAELVRGTRSGRGTAGTFSP